MRRKNKSHSFGRLSTFEQAALVFWALASGPHKIGAGQDYHNPVQSDFREEN